MTVSASIVTFNSENKISMILDSIYNSTTAVETIVIDNASKDGTVSFVQNRYPFVKFIQSEINLGFGKANNLAIQTLNSDYHIIANPDIQFAPDVIERLCDFMEENPDVVLIIPKFLNMDGTEQFTPKRIPTIKYLLSGYLEHIFHKEIKARSEYTFRNQRITEPVDIGFTSGCFMFCRTDALKKVKGFDEKFFLYLEDADLGRRMKEYGRVMYFPNVAVTHHWDRNNHNFGSGMLHEFASIYRYYKKWKWKKK